MYGTEIKTLFYQKRLAPLHQLGQHFLLDHFVLRKIVDAAELTRKDTVLEIGTGTGELTAALAEKAGKIISIEKDKKLAALARQRFASYKGALYHSGKGHLYLIHADALRLTPHLLSAVLRTKRKLPIKGAGLKPKAYSLKPFNYKVVANLPYSITGAFFRKFLNCKLAPLLMVVMIQKEVADRILKKEPPFDLLGIITQFYGQASLVAKVPRTAFWPQPKVDSAVVKIVLKGSLQKIGRREPSLQTRVESTFLKLVRAGFSQRRKTLINALTHNLKKPKSQISQLLNAAGIDFSLRAEQLSLVQWISLATEAQKLKV